ncbi:MAG: hypothetical protein COU33_04195, partial [Candidatus Magasanikbacteria bacterium CG10_big_fil_rev_8_21_14_0_10_43_6]
FDVDNTLYQTNQAFTLTLRQAVEHLHMAGKQVSFPPPETLQEVKKRNLSFEDMFQELFVDAADEVLRVYREIAPGVPYEPVQGAHDAVATLKKQGIVMGLVTNRVRMLEERLIQANFVGSDFVCMSMPAKSSFAKPHPRAFEEALQILEEKGIGPHEVVMCGDHLDDYYAATGRGLSFVAIVQGDTTREEFLAAGVPEYLIREHLGDISEVIATVNKSNAYKRSVYNTSAIDTRYAEQTAVLQPYFSEFAFHKYRVMVEVEHVIALSTFSNGLVVRRLEESEIIFLRRLYQRFSEKDALHIIDYDHVGRRGIGPVEHDTKACELWIQEKLEGTTLADISEKVHLFVTSEDIRNLAWKSMLRDALEHVFVPEFLGITGQLKQLAITHAYDPVMGRTHMQPASPTTFGKIFGTYLVRLTRALNRLGSVKVYGKINGAVGNYNSFVAAYTHINWCDYSKYLTAQLGFYCELWTDQRGPVRDMVEVFQALQEAGAVMRDLAQDMSLYGSLNTIYFTKVESHVGSSVMPHKVNPWFAEVAEGAIKKANALISLFATDLDVSRLQRDLSDHELERGYGDACAYLYIAMHHLAIGLAMIRPNTVYARQELVAHPEIMTEAIQTILRKHGHAAAYETVKARTRGISLSFEDLKQFVSELAVEEYVKQDIISILLPERYIGLSGQLALDAVAYYDSIYSSK